MWKPFSCHIPLYGREAAEASAIGSYHTVNARLTKDTAKTDCEPVVSNVLQYGVERFCWQ